VEFRGYSKFNISAFYSPAQSFRSLHGSDSTYISTRNTYESSLKGSRLGIIVDVPINKKLSFQYGLLHNKYGEQSHYILKQVNEFGDTISFINQDKNTYSSLTLPVMFSFNKTRKPVAFRPGFGLGLSYLYKVKGNTVSENSEDLTVLTENLIGKISVDAILSCAIVFQITDELGIMMNPLMTYQVTGANTTNSNVVSRHYNLSLGFGASVNF
jgi:hypothetical protein